MTGHIKITNLFLDSFARIFNIREGEVQRTGLMLVYLFFFITALMIVKPVSHALFLTQFGADQLPFAYILTAVFAATISSVYALLLKKVPLDRLMAGTLRSAIGLLILFWIFIHYQWLKAWALYLFFVWIGLFSLICASQFWLSAGILFNVREAKRLFGPIGTGAIVGGILGGYITKILAPVVGSDNLMVISMVFLFGCIRIMDKLWRNHLDTRPEFNRENLLVKSEQKEKPLAMIRKSRHLAFLAGILAVSVIVSKLVDYQFNVIAVSQITDKDQLAAFLGFWLSNLNFLSLLVQIFLTRRIVGVFGVGTSLFFLPMAVFLGAVTTFLYPALWSGILIKLSEGGFKNSLNKSGMELLSLPIPAEIRNQTKTFIDVFVDSAATGVGGLILIGLIYGAGISPASVSIAIMVFLLVWFYFIKRAKEAYIQTFRAKIEVSSRIQNHDMKPDLKKESVLGGIIRILEGSNPNDIIRTLNMLSDLQNDKLAPYLVRLLDHPLEEVRLGALKNLYYYRKVLVLKQAESFLSADRTDLKTEAIRYIFLYSEDRYEKLRIYLSERDYKIRGAALICLARESRLNRTLKTMFRPEEFISQAILSVRFSDSSEENIFTKKTCAQAISMAEIPDLCPYLYLLMDDADQGVVVAAITASGQTQNPEFIPVLLNYLGRRPAYKRAAMEALTNYGPQIFDELNQALNNTYIGYNIRKHIPGLIAAAGIQKSVDLLLRHLEQPDLGLRFEIIKALNRLRITSEQLLFDKKGIVKGIKKEAQDYRDMLMILYAQKRSRQTTSGIYRHLKNPELEKAGQQLVSALEIRLDASLERLFRLLGLNYPPVEIFDIYKSLRSQDMDIRLNSMEFLDNLLDINLKNIILPVIETGIITPDSSTLGQGSNIPDEYSAFVSLLNGQDDLLREKTLYLLSFFPDEHYIPHVAGLLNSPNSGVRHMARSVLQEMGFFKAN